MEADDWLTDTRTTYDRIAGSYADQVRDSLPEHPYLRAALALFADLVHRAGGGPVADMGCGPGHVTAHLQSLGVDAFGIDLSPAMIEIARREHPGLRFEVGSMTDPGFADKSITGVLVWWSLMYIPDDAVAAVLGHFRRALRPGGPVMVGFHVGNRAKGHSHHRAPGTVAAWLREAGLAVDAQLVLRPDANVPGAVLVAHRPHDTVHP